MGILDKLKTALSNTKASTGSSGPSPAEVKAAVEKLQQEGWLDVVDQQDKGSNSTVLIIGLSRMESRMELRLLDFLKVLNAQVQIGILASETEAKTTDPNMLRFFPDKERNEKMVRSLLGNPQQDRAGATPFVGFYMATESTAPFLPLFDLGDLTPQIAMAAARGEADAQRKFLEATKQSARRAAARLTQEMQKRQCAFALLQCQPISLQFPSGFAAKTAWADQPANIIACILH